MSDDEKFEEWLRAASAEYNCPPETVPQDEMWDAIRTSRATRAPRAERGGELMPLAGRRISRWTPAWTAATAGLLLIAGIAIGRRWTPVTGVATVVSREGQGRVGVTPATTPERGGSRVGSNVDEPDRSSSPSRGDVGAAPAYAAATAAHLDRAEVLLTSFRAMRASGRIDASLAAWARDLLTTTRLLLDSPAGVDAQRRKLLEDLELVLVQMAQLAPGGRAEDNDMIDRTIEDADVLNRVRVAVPRGSAIQGS